MRSPAVMPTGPPGVDYALTDLGEEVIPAIRAIVAVGTKLRARTMAERADCAVPPC